MPINVKASNGDTPFEVHLSGDIGDWGMQGKDLRNALSGIPQGRKINLRINSQGGSVGEGLEMYHAIHDRAGDCTAWINGYAVSAASIVPLAAGKVISPAGSVWMIHCAACGTYGNADDKLKDAEMLEVHDEEMATIYTAKTGKSRKAIMDAMKAETWMTSDEAVEFGLADESPAPDGDPIMSALVSNRFKNVPERILASIRNKTAVLATGNPHKTMDKKKLVAFLKTKGVEASVDWTDEQFESALNTVGIVAKGNDNAAGGESIKQLTDGVQAMRDLLAAETRKRITAAVTAKADNKIPTANLTWWIDQAIKDESGVMAQIDALPLQTPGGAQIGNSISITAENPLDKIKAEFKGAGGESTKNRYLKIRGDWKALHEDACARDARSSRSQRGDVNASNTYAGALVTQFLLDGAVTKLQNKWAALRCFTRDFGTDRYKPRATAELKYVDSSDGNVQKNATNFEAGDTTVDAVAIAVDQYSRSFNVSNNDLNSGLRMENLLELNMSVFADKIIQVATAPITAANFGVLPAQVVAPGNFNWGAMTIPWGLLKKSTIHNALLDGEYLAQIINVPTQFQKSGVEPGAAWAEFGWDNIALNTNWTGADANVRGFFCNPQAIGAITGLPLTPPNIPGATLQESTIMVPGVDVTVANYAWFSLASRTHWMSFDLMFGASLIDNTAGVILRSA